ncbi:MAG TPA: ATP-dependent zinc metalloprotease FtsH [Oscillospiraceae bacterium]|nr:ATP-dependent zinc metalloprotease FtsH [Oscillospiraceae bacterium]
MNPKRNNRGILVYVVIALCLMFSLLLLLKMSSEPASQYKYSDIVKYFDDYKVYEYSLDLGTGELKMRVEGEDKYITYKVPNVSVFIDEIQGEDRNYRKEYNELHPDKPLKQDYYPIQDHSWIVNMIPTVILLGVMVVLFIFTMRQAGGGGKISQFGKANVKAQSQSAKKTTFADVAGAEEEKAEMAEIVDFLKNPRKYVEIGARIPKGVLLLGPPGTGKTLLARAVAGEAGVPFFSISGSDFVEMFVGVGASRVRDLFETAKKNSPSIVFIDEIDAVGRHRGAGLGGGHDEREQTLNQLLVEMDGFTENESVIVVAATNRRDILDPALLRPGRFDRQIVVGYPDVKGREEVLKVHSRNKPLGPDVNLPVIAKTTQGFTGADLENLLNEAALLAARANRKAIIEADIEEATLKVIAGPEKKSRVVTDRDKKITAYHECGHAIAAYYLETQEKVHQVTVIPRGFAAGLTVTRPSTDDRHVSKRKMQEEITMTLGGRVAEAIIFDDVCTGASSDLKRATKVAREMVTQYGFSEVIGPVVYGGDDEEVFIGKDYGHTKNYSDSVAAEIDGEVRRLIEESYEQSKAILEAHIDQLHKLAEYLLEYEKIDSEDFEKFMKGEFTIEQKRQSEKKEADKPTEEIGKILDVTVGEEPKPEDPEQENGGFYK